MTKYSAQVIYTHIMVVNNMWLYSSITHLLKTLIWTFTALLFLNPHILLFKHGCFLLHN